MSTLVIRNVPDDLHERLKAQAKRNHRSLTKEAVNLIEQQLSAPRVAPKLARPLKLKSGPLTMKQIDSMITHGRD